MSPTHLRSFRRSFLWGFLSKAEKIVSEKLFAVSNPGGFRQVNSLSVTASNYSQMNKWAKKNWNSTILIFNLGRRSFWLGENEPQSSQEGQKAVDLHQGRAGQLSHPRRPLELGAGLFPVLPVFWVQLQVVARIQRGSV